MLPTISEKFSQDFKMKMRGLDQKLINKMSVIKSVRRRCNKKKRQRDRNQFINRHYSLFSSKHKTIIEVNESLEILNFINLFIHTQQ